MTMDGHGCAEPVAFSGRRGFEEKRHATFPYIWAALVGAALSFPAHAQQPPCGERSVFLRIFFQNYGEVPVMRGLISQDAMLEILASPKGTFSVMVTRPNGVMCAVFSGQELQNVTPEPPVGPQVDQ